MKDANCAHVSDSCSPPAWCPKCLDSLVLVAPAALGVPGFSGASLTGFPPGSDGEGRAGRTIWINDHLKFSLCHFDLANIHEVDAVK